MSNPVPIQPAQSDIIKAFRLFLPEFDEQTYPDNMLIPAVVLARNMVDIDKWGELGMYATSLLIAHYLVVRGKATTDDNGIVTDKGDLIATSKSVGGVSVSYSLPSSSNTSAGYGSGLASTSYGREYLNLTQLFGIGAIVLCQ